MYAGRHVECMRQARDHVEIWRSGKEVSDGNNARANAERYLLGHAVVISVENAFNVAATPTRNQSRSGML